MAAFRTAEEHSEFQALTRQPYARQAQRFLNAFWTTVFEASPEQCEAVWAFCASFAKLDTHGAEGCELDEFEAHQFLEHNVGAMTVADMRKALERIDVDENRKLSLAEFLLFHYEVDARGLVRWAPSGTEAQQTQIAAVQKQMVKAQDSLDVAKTRAEESRVEASRAEATASAAGDAALFAEHAAQEQHAATVELERQEKQKSDTIEEEFRKSTDESTSVVKRHKAKAQLAILKSEDSQPLRTARITSGAAERKAKKAAKVSLEAAAVARSAAFAADAAARGAERAIQDADRDIAALTEQLEEAKASYSGAGEPAGTFWWLDREFEESLKFMSSKQRAKALAARDASRRKSGTFKP
mmetsp:Transcript_15138/g.45865  ORF Transcript_15138/g.45865 Transcript_15138/m.45865 type:complete len:356 (+) Transcript_15138:18-1085(+)